MGTNETGNIQKSFPKCHLVLCRENLTESREETKFMKKKEMRFIIGTPNLGGFVIFFRELKLSLEIVRKWNGA